MHKNTILSQSKKSIVRDADILALVFSTLLKKLNILRELSSNQVASIYSLAVGSTRPYRPILQSLLLGLLPRDAKPSNFILQNLDVCIRKLFGKW